MRWRSQGLACKDLLGLADPQRQQFVMRLQTGKAAYHQQKLWQEFQQPVVVELIANDKRDDMLRLNVSSKTEKKQLHVG